MPRDQVITVARQFAENADKTEGRSMVIIGAGMNHWYHSDMNYRGIINMLMMCGCIGKSGGGWAHYVGQEKLRPQTGWTALAFALDWIRPPRQMNSHQLLLRPHRPVALREARRRGRSLSPLADKRLYGGSMIDYNVRAERMGWLPTRAAAADQSDAGGARRRRRGLEPKDYAVKALQGRLAEDELRGPGPPGTTGRATCSSGAPTSSAPRGKGHEYFLQAPARHQQRRAGQGPGQPRRPSPPRWSWHDKAPEGKLDLLVTLDFRMSTTCLYSDIVLPTATWYEKNDLNTSDMHPFIHPLSTAVDPVWQSRSDWEIYKGFAKTFSEVCVGHLGVEQELVLTPLMHDTPGELAQPFEVQDWKTRRVRARSRARPRRRSRSSSATTRTSTSASPRSAR